MQNYSGTSALGLLVSLLGAVVIIIGTYGALVIEGRDIGLLRIAIMLSTTSTGALLILIGNLASVIINHVTASSARHAARNTPAPAIGAPGSGYSIDPYCGYRIEQVANGVWADGKSHRSIAAAHAYIDTLPHRPT